MDSTDTTAAAAAAPDAAAADAGAPATDTTAAAAAGVDGQVGNVPEAPPASRLHTYPDGSQRVGVDPFPEMSPLEEEQKALRDATPAQDTFARAEAAKAAAAGMVTANDVTQVKS